MNTTYFGLNTPQKAKTNKKNSSLKNKFQTNQMKTGKSEIPQKKNNKISNEAKQAFIDAAHIVDNFVEIEKLLGMSKSNVYLYLYIII